MFYVRSCTNLLLDMVYLKRGLFGHLPIPFGFAYTNHPNKTEHTSNLEVELYRQPFPLQDDVL